MGKTGSRARPFRPARALLHLGWGLPVVAYWLMEIPAAPFLLIFLVVSFVFIGVDAGRLFHPGLNQWCFDTFGPFLREREYRRLTGASWYLVAILLTVSLYPRQEATAAILIMSVGDPTATLVGERWGRLRLGEKSLEGSLAFAIGAALVAWPVLGWRMALPGALVATLIELCPLPLDDNLSVPLFTGAVLALLRPMV